MLNLSFYRFATKLYKYNQRYLSVFVKKKEDLRYNCKKSRFYILKAHFSLILGIIILFVLIAAKFLNYLYIPSNIGYLDFFKTIILIPLTFIGFIIPIILLVTNNISNKHPAYSGIYLKCCLKPFQTFAVLILVFLTNLAFYFYLFLNNSTFNPNIITSSFILVNNASQSTVPDIITIVAQYLILIGLSLVLFSSIEVVRLVNSTISSFNDTNFYNSIRKSVMKKMVNEIYVERDKKKSRAEFEKICHDMDLETNYLDKWYENRYKPLNSSKDGFVKDVDLEKLKEFQSLLEHEFELCGHVFKAIVHQVGYNMGNNAIGFVHRNEENTLSLERILNEAYIIKKREVNSITSIFDSLKDSVIKSIEKNEESQFDKITDIYVGLLEDYMECMVKDGTKFDSDWLQAPSEPFLSLMLIRKSFADVAKAASNSHNENLIINFLYKLLNLSKKAIHNLDYSVISIIMDTYRNSYRGCVKNNNDLGRGRVFLNLKNIINYIISLWDDKDYLLNFRDLRELFYNFIGLLVNIGQMTIDYEDFNGLDKIVSMLNGFYIEPDNETYERHLAMENRLRELKNDNEERDKLEGQINCIKERIDITNDFNRHLKSYWFELGSYIICRFTENNLENYREYITKFLNKFSSYQELLETFENITSDNTIVYGAIKRFTNGDLLDLERCNLRFFCIRGIQLISQTRPPINSQTIQFKLPSIESFCDEIKNNLDDWEWLVGQDVEKIDGFIDLCRNSA